MTVESLEQYFTSNPNAIDPKFSGDAKKAAESVVNLQSAFTKTSQELADLKRQQVNTQTPDPNTTTADPSRNGPAGGTTQGSSLDGLSIPEPPKVENVWSKIESSVKELGEVSDEIVAEAIAAGIPENVVRGFKGMVSDASKLAKQHQVELAAQLLGGREAVEACLKYASTLPPNERQAINNGLKSEAWQTFLTGLNARRLKASGNEPNRQVNVSGNGDTSSNPFGIVIKSHSDLLRYQSTPRYRTDPAYANAVVEASNKFFGKKK